MTTAGKFFKRNVRTFAGASLTTSPQAVGLQTTIAGYKIAIVNATTTDVTISDGSGQDNYILPANTTLNVGEGVLISEGQAPVRMGTQFTAALVSGVAGTGSLVITVIGS